MSENKYTLIRLLYGITTALVFSNAWSQTQAALQLHVIAGNFIKSDVADRKIVRERRHNSEGGGGYAFVGRVGSGYAFAGSGGGGYASSGGGRPPSSPVTPYPVGPPGQAKQPTGGGGGGGGDDNAETMSSPKSRCRRNVDVGDRGSRARVSRAEVYSTGGGYNVGSTQPPRAGGGAASGDDTGSTDCVEDESPAGEVGVSGTAGDGTHHTSGTGGVAGGDAARVKSMKKKTARAARRSVPKGGTRRMAPMKRAKAKARAARHPSMPGRMGMGPRQK